MTARPLVSFGAAFLATVAAALFAPWVLSVLAFLPIAMLFITPAAAVRRGLSPCLGAIAATVCCGVHWLLGGGAATIQLSLDSYAEAMRSYLCQQALAANPAPSTSLTLGILFGYKDGISPTVQEALRRSGMSHLLSVSGLHMSIAAVGAGAITRKLGLGRHLQFMFMTATALVFWLASGTSVSATRALIMILLGLGAKLLRRRADGLSSLSLAAVLLVGLSPPLLGELSFLLSFLAVLGILTLASPFRDSLVTLWQAVFGNKRRTPVALISAIGVSLAAQLATAPVIAWQFGSVPLLGVLLNLVTIPLVYPVMLLGLLGCAAAAAGLGGVGALLLAAANACAQLIAWVASGAAQLPFCSATTLFPINFAVLFAVIIAIALALLLPTTIRRWRRVAAGVAAVACLAICINIAVERSTIAVASSSRTGSLVIASASGAVLVDNTANSYQRLQDQALLMLLGHSKPTAILLSHPFATQKQLDETAQFYSLPADALYHTAPLTGGTLLGTSTLTAVSGISINAPAPYCTQITISTTKLMKYDAVYDTIIESEGQIPYRGAVFADYAGNLLDATGRHSVLRRPDGVSTLRIAHKKRRA